MATVSAHEAALAWAAHLREARSSLCRALGSAEVGLAEVLERRDDPAVGAVHLRSVLESLPGARKVDTRRALARMGLAEDTPLSALSPEEVSAVLDRFGPDAAGSAR